MENFKLFVPDYILLHKVNIDKEEKFLMSNNKKKRIYVINESISIMIQILKQPLYIEELIDEMVAISDSTYNEIEKSLKILVNDLYQLGFIHDFEKYKSIVSPSVKTYS